MKTTSIVLSVSLCPVLGIMAGELDQSATTNEFKYTENATLPFYISVNPAVPWVQDVSFSDSLQSSTMRFHPGVGIDAVFGHNFNEAWAVEFDVGFIYVKSSTKRDTGIQTVHDFLTQCPFMGNLRYQIPTHSRWHPFVGVGLGGVYTSLDDEEDLFGIPGTIHAGSDFVFGYQAFGGVRYEFTRRFEMGLEYRFMGTTEHDLGDVRMDPTYSHSLVLVFSFPF
jgi:opacity protein-like surface antigen